MTKNIAIIDLGSSSFYLCIVQVDARKRFKTLRRHKFKAQLRLGINEQGELTLAAQQQALAYLAEFATLLQRYQVKQVHAVGTYTLRTIKNSEAFLVQAQQTLGFSIEIISGDEEARLVYVGATAKRSSRHQTLVVDIGGGSTELIIGKGREILRSVSLAMGCVSFQQRFFADGALTRQAFDLAITAAREVLVPINPEFNQAGWQACVGFSGTIQMISRVMKAGGLSGGSIDAEGLDQVIDKLISFHRVEAIVLPGLREDRASLLAGGVAILKAIFEVLPIRQLTLSLGGVREGLLVELLQRI